MGKNILTEQKYAMGFDSFITEMEDMPMEPEQVAPAPVANDLDSLTAQLNQVTGELAQQRNILKDMIQAGQKDTPEFQQQIQVVKDLQDERNQLEAQQQEAIESSVGGAAETSISDEAEVAAAAEEQEQL